MLYLTEMCILEIGKSSPILGLRVGLKREEKVPQACSLGLLLQLLMLGRDGPFLLLIVVSQLLLYWQHSFPHKLCHLASTHSQHLQVASPMTNLRVELLHFWSQISDCGC